MSGEEELAPSDPLERHGWELARMSEMSGQVLGTLESLRRRYDDSGDRVQAWTLVVIERMLCAFPVGTAEHRTLHNLVVDSMSAGLADVSPPTAADLAHDIHLPGEDE